MKVLMRIVLQTLFWAIVWVIMALGHEDMTTFIEQNWVIYIIQILIVILLTYFLASKVLAKKNQMLFVVFGFTSILVCALLAYQFSVQGPPQIPLEDRNADTRMIPSESMRANNRQDINRNLPPRPGRNLTPFGRLLNSPFLINFLLLCLTVILTTVVEIFLFAKKKEEALILSKTENLETELKLLKSQINPHFLFNALNNIYALSVIDSAKTQQSISYLSNMLRYVLYECERPYVALQKEIDYIENYIKLFNLKSSRTYPIETNFNISEGNIEIAPMMLIPFVENAFKHSNIEKIDGAYIKIHLNVTGSEIHFRIENTIEEHIFTKDEVGGIGLENVKKRLEILYPRHHKLSISEENSVFKVQLNLKSHA